MQIKISRSALVTGLGMVQGIVERRSTMPILANVLLHATAQQLSITATDLEVGINWSTQAEVLSEGRVTVHARSLYDIVRELPETAVHLSVQELNRIEIVCGKSRFRIMGLAPEEYPVLPVRGEGQPQRIEGKILQSMMEKAAFAMSSDETRYNLNGVYTDFSGGSDGATIQMVATDGHRLSIVQRQAKGEWRFPKGGIVPRKGMTELKRLVEGEEVIDLWIDGKHLIAYCGSTTLVVRLIDGQFPPFEQVVPKKSTRVISLPRGELIHALKRVAVMASDRSHGVKFSISPGNLEISAQNPDLGDAREELTAAYKGESFEVGFNARYFIDALSAINDEQAVLELGEETSPCVLRSELDHGFTHVIMPMRL
jgi:DNA polymerase-3 subunit beta